jgi:hypothetical protein
MRRSTDETDDELDAIWFPLAKAFGAYITGFEQMFIYTLKCAGDDYPSSVIRVWEDGKVFGPNRIRDTIVFKPTEIICNNSNEGILFIELADPQSLDVLLGWMKRCWLIEQEITLAGILANGKIKSAN